MPCNPRSAIAGLNSCLRLLLSKKELRQAVLNAGSCAIEIRKPRQIREEAAVIEPFYVPHGLPGWSRLLKYRFEAVVEGGCAVIFLIFIAGG